MSRVINAIRQNDIFITILSASGVFVSTWTGSLDGDDPTAQNGPGEIVLELRKSTVSMSASKRGKKQTAQAAAIAPAWRERDPMTQYLRPVEEHQQATGCCPVRGDSRERDRGKEHEREKRQCRRSDARLAHVVRGKRRVPGRHVGQRGSQRIRSTLTPV